MPRLEIEREIEIDVEKQLTESVRAGKVSLKGDGSTEAPVTLPDAAHVAMPLHPCHSPTQLSTRSSPISPPSLTPLACVARPTVLGEAALARIRLPAQLAHVRALIGERLTTDRLTRWLRDASEQFYFRIDERRFS